MLINFNFPGVILALIYVFTLIRLKTAESTTTLSDQNVEQYELTFAVSKSVIKIYFATAIGFLAVLTLNILMLMVLSALNKLRKPHKPTDRELENVEEEEDDDEADEENQKTENTKKMSAVSKIANSKLSGIQKDNRKPSNKKSPAKPKEFKFNARVKGDIETLKFQSADAGTKTDLKSFQGFN